MDPSFTFITIENTIMTFVTVVVLYMTVLAYRLPYSQVVLAYASIFLLNAILTKLFYPNILTGERRRPLDARTVSRQAMSIIGESVFDFVVGIIGFIATIVIASYRFSFVEILGILAAGMASGVISSGILAIL